MGLEEPILFAQKHNDLLQTKAQKDFETLQTNQEFQEASILIKTVTAIEAGEELTINYNGDWDDERKIWFEAE